MHNVLLVIVNHLYGPSHGVNFVGPQEVEGGVCGQYATPRGALAAAYVEDSDRNVVKVGVGDDIVAFVQTAVLYAGLL